MRKKLSKIILMDEQKLRFSAGRCFFLFFGVVVVVVVVFSVFGTFSKGQVRAKMNHSRTRFFPSPLPPSFLV